MSKLANHRPYEAKDGQTHKHDGYPPHSHDASDHHTVQGLKRKRDEPRPPAYRQPTTSAHIILELEGLDELRGGVKILAQLAITRGVPAEDILDDIQQAAIHMMA